MGSAMGGMMQMMQILQIIFVYGLLTAMVFMLYKVNKEVGEIKRAITDLQDSITFGQLPPEARTGHPAPPQA